MGGETPNEKKEIARRNMPGRELKAGLLNVSAIAVELEH
jgi:hypothetical protein